MNIRIIIVMVAIVTMFLQVGAQNPCISPMLWEKGNSIGFERIPFALEENNIEQLSYPEPTTFRAMMDKAGTLAEVIGDNLYDIDRIVVIGPMNDEDFNTLWASTFKGRLRNINLENATIDNGKLPDYALFHIDEQVDWSTITISTIGLEELILPEGVTEIGDFAVAYATNLKSLKIPETVKKIGEAAFTDCISFSPEVFILPSSLEHIESQAFYQCLALSGEVILPIGLKSIKDAAFYYAPITAINFPESLEYIGSLAFAGSKFTNVCLPNDCWLEWLGGQFYNNSELTEAHFPENATFIPQKVFGYCPKLKEVNIPRNVERIGQFAFNGTAITNIQFPETLRQIDQDAFQACSQLTTIIFPESLTTIETHAFNLCKGLESVWCKAMMPPDCIPSDCEETIDPFSQIDKSIPLYVPVGTKEAYMAAPGWNLFPNIIETNNFPSSVEVVKHQESKNHNGIFDLLGRSIITPVKGQIYIQKGKKIVYSE